MIVLSHYQARPLLEARAAGVETAVSSADLNLTTCEVVLDEGGVSFPGGVRVSWANLEHIAGAKNTCFEVEEDDLREIRVFSEETDWVRSLYPTSGAPSMLVSGMVMHRVEGIDPMQDTLNKLRAVAPVVGHVLDTCTGLGYTAIEAARTAEHVTTVELDPASIAIARRSPWSRGLFDNPRITRLIGDVWEVVETMEDGAFARIIHDPPTFSFAGELYSGEFYAELYRVLSRKGRLFHYIGDPDSKAIQRIMRGVIRRLGEAGFSRVTPSPRAFGVVAYK